jgi:four helix bundle protein
MNYQIWVQHVPTEFTTDPLWNVEAYRLALFLADISWEDVTQLMKDQRTLALSDQLYRALGSISANLAEGYSMSTGKNRARYFEYALGSARESRGWYYKGRHILSKEVVDHRINFLTQIIRLLIKMIPQQRRSQGIREADVTYEINPEVDQEILNNLLDNVPSVMSDE